MAFTIAIAGKGGTGKTTFTCLVIRSLIKQEVGSILAVDADPSANLAEFLGLEAEETIGKIIEEVSRNLDKIPAGMTKDRFIEYRVQGSLLEARGFDLLTMGHPEGPGCYCYPNTVLRGLIEKLVKAYDFAVIDNEAGLEHLSRRTARCADLLVILSDYSLVGIRSAAKIFQLTKELKIGFKEAFLVIGLARGGVEQFSSQIEASGLKLGGVIPYDQELAEFSLKGNPIMDLSDHNPTVEAVDGICERIIPKDNHRGHRER